MENVVSDIRLAARGLIRAPGFTAMAVATIALGLGANAAIFSVVNGVLLRPLPYADSDELTRVWGRFLPESGFDFPYFPVDPTEYVDVRDDGRAFESVAAYTSQGVALSGADGMAERRGGLVTTWNLFSLLGVEASLGRTFVPDDDIEGGPDVAVVSHALWETRFGADPGIVGSTVALNRETFEVVGVLPRGFSFPGPGVDVYMPLQLGENPSNRRAHYLNVVARRADGVSLEMAEADVRRLMAGWALEYPDIHTGHFLFLEGFKDAMVRGVRPALLLLLGAVGFVLLVACANVANLLMVRGTLAPARWRCAGPWGRAAGASSNSSWSRARSWPRWAPCSVSRSRGSAFRCSSRSRRAPCRSPTRSPSTGRSSRSPPCWRR